MTRTMSRNMTRNWQRMVFVAVALSVMAVAVGCGSATSAPISGLNTLGGVSVSITPAVMTVPTGTTQPFTATVNGSGLQAVQWQVNGIPGGQASIGTIDSTGNYTAPQFVPTPATVQLTAIANADNTKQGDATVTITGTLLPAQVFMSPTGTAYVQSGTELKLAGGVTGPADTGVVWQVNGVANGNSTVGTITPGANNTAVYNAPATVPSPATVTIKAVSHAEQTAFTSCTVTLSAQAPSIATVTVTPVIAVVQAQSSFTFTADVINAGDDSVSWEANTQIGGNQIDGTIASESGGTGVFVAPAAIPAQGSAVIVTAVSNAQPTRSSSANVSISGAVPNSIGVTVSGGSALNANSSEQVSATVFATGLGVLTNSSVTWQVNGITGGNSIYGTIVSTPGNLPNEAIYTAPATIPAQNTVVLGAVSNQSPTVVGTLPVTISVPPVKVSVICYPNVCPKGSESLGINLQQQFELQVEGLSNDNGTWYVCTNTNPQTCYLGGNSTVGTISPDSGADLVTYTAPASVPNPATVIIKAIPVVAPTQFATAMVTISPIGISVEISPSGPFTVQVNDSSPALSATVNGSQDQTVSWFVNGILNGNSTVGTMQPDSQNINNEDYIAPANVPDPPTVLVTAEPEADPGVVSNAVSINIIPTQNQVSIQFDTQFYDLIPGTSEQVGAEVLNSSDQIVNWTLAPTAGGTCTDPNPPTPCGSITPQTNGVEATYTAPQNPPSDPYQVTITATADALPRPQVSAPITITANATASITIFPSPANAIAGSSNVLTFGVNTVNVPGNPNINWSMSCNSLAPPGPNGTGENCGKAFGKKYPDGGGPGCIDYPGETFNLCNGPGPGSDSFDLADNLTFTYTPPGTLSDGGQIYMAVAECNTSPGQTDGYVAITAELDAGNCPNGICQATQCVQISPAALPK
jgi:hypothetical protein